MQQLFDRPIAHRGLHDRAGGIIENSASAFERAIEGGYAIECDVQLTADGEPVVIHDDRLGRLTGLGGYVRDVTADTLCSTPLLGSAEQDRPQRFSTFLRQIGGRTLIQVELKRQRYRSASEALANSVASALAAYDGPAVIESFDPDLIALARDFGFAGKRGIIAERYLETGEDHDGLSRRQRFSLRHLLHWPRTRFDFISCDKTALGLPAVRLFAALGMPVTAWTIRSRQEAQQATARGAQLVFEGFAPDAP